MAYKPEAFPDDSGDYASVDTNLTYDTDLDIRAYCALVNSSAMQFFYYGLFRALKMGGFQFQAPQLRQLPVPPMDQSLPDGMIDQIGSRPELSEFDWDSATTAEILAELSQTITDAMHTIDRLNLNISDYLGGYDFGPSLGELTNGQPATGVADSIFNSTAEEYENLRFDDIAVERDGDDLRIVATARYKPDNPDEFVTNSHGYTSTEIKPIYEILDPGSNEAQLIESFVPYATDRASGFADFRQNATKNISLLDRLVSLSLPELGDVEDGIHRYHQRLDQARDLDELAHSTLEIIDQIVYQLYGYSRDEVEVIESYLRHEGLEKEISEGF
jgi:hypothetical protein